MSDVLSNGVRDTQKIKDTHREQALKYGVAKKVPFVVVTNGQVFEILNVKTLDVHENEGKIFKNGEKIRFQINYRINRDFLDPTFGIGFFTNDGTYIFGTTTKIDGFEMNLSNKNGYIYLDVDNLFLAGLYLSKHSLQKYLGLQENQLYFFLLRVKFHDQVNHMDLGR